MGNKIKLTILSALIAIIAVSFSLERIKITKEKNDWKKLTLCLCLYEYIPLNDSIRRLDGSLAAYIQTNSLFGIDDLDKTRIFVSKYLNSIKIKSKTNRSLTIMKCIELYESEELDDFVDSLANTALQPTNE